MSDWQERITHETAPAIRAEHELRYRVAAPLIKSSALWADLGCGNGIASSAALGDARPEHVVLVDVAPGVPAAAAAELGMPQAGQLDGDLTDVDCIREIERALAAADGPRTVTCFEVVEHLSTFVPFVEWAGELARNDQATIVLSVPNDAFWSMQNPHHETTWGEGAFEELRRLLPDEQTVVRQVALSGSAVVGWQAEQSAHELTVDVGGPGAVATHFLAAFGPRHAELWRGAVAIQADDLAQRRWERERESNLAAIESEAQTLRDRLRANDEEFTAWRTYIHELEGELGRPPSGSPAAQQAERTPAAGEQPSDGSRSSRSALDSARQ